MGPALVCTGNIKNRYGSPVVFDKATEPNTPIDLEAFMPEIRHLL